MFGEDGDEDVDDIGTSLRRGIFTGFIIRSESEFQIAYNGITYAIRAKV